MKKFIQILVLTLAFLPFQAGAQPVANIDAEAAKVEAYLNGLKTLQARFVQTANDGTQLVGTFYLSRPGKLRFEYDPPIEDFVVADGLFIYFYDAELGEQTNSPIGQTLADFLLRDDIRLSDDITLEGIKRGGGFLQVELTQTSDPAAGKLSMAFEEDPLNLSKWRIVDAQGMITEVELFHVKTDVQFRDGMFNYVAPKPDKPAYNP